ncbi:MAG: hypothetical protein GKR96_03705 [Gammaproteobacteria bacterium]|nr:hypothetical protein [Gammaproteobacteria bacterium]
METLQWHKCHCTLSSSGQAPEIYAALVKSQVATCLDTGVGLHKNMGKQYQLENDHIFPSAVLKKNGYGRDNRVKYQYAQEFTNRAILTQVANRKKSASSAEDYFCPRFMRNRRPPLKSSVYLLIHHFGR